MAVPTASSTSSGSASARQRSIAYCRASARWPKRWRSSNTLKMSQGARAWCFWSCFVAALCSAAPPARSEPTDNANTNTRLDHQAPDPRDALEREVQRIFERLLGASPIGRHESFFDLGGSSISLLHLLKEIRERTRFHLPFYRLFHAPTIAGVAETLRGLGCALEARPGGATADG